MKKLLKKIISLIIIIILAICVEVYAVEDSNTVNKNGEVNKSSQENSNDSTSENIDKKTNTEENTELNNNTEEKINTEEKNNTEESQTEEQKTSDDTTVKKTEQDNSSTSKLSGITVNGTQVDDGGKLTVDGNKSTVEVYGQGESLYYITVNGKSSSNNVSLNEGSNTIIVKGASGNQFTIYVTREGKTDITKSNNVIENNVTNENTNTTTNEMVNELIAEKSDTMPELCLKSLNIEGAELSPKFSASVYSYRIKVKKDCNKVKVTATANIDDAVVKVDGADNLEANESVINIIVTSADGSKNVTYQIAVDKKDEIITATTSNDNKSAIFIGIAGVIIIISVIVYAVLKNRKGYVDTNEFDVYDDENVEDIEDNVEDIEDNEKNKETDSSEKIKSKLFDWNKDVEDEQYTIKSNKKGRHA